MIQQRRKLFGTLILLPLCIFALAACQNSSHNNDNNNQTEITRENTRQKLPEEKDTIRIKESFSQENLVITDYLANELVPIRENFKRINSISNWTFIDTKELWQTTEGGQADFYCRKDVLEKITPWF